MDGPPGNGRDSRFNMAYNMSLLSGEGPPEIYGNASRQSTSLNSVVSRSSLSSLPNTCSANIQRGLKRSSSDVYMDQEVSSGRNMPSHSGMNIECGSDLGDESYTESKKTPPPNGKKTKGRVKIKMEYIDNKLRRYTTFSKRKTGIMKKAYELSTLTGTQVMLLVASETGHVYTFATRKLQPMITSDAGKALIQTCLNSPDPPASGVGGDQRMSATGFEETELTYNIGDDEQKDDDKMSSRSDDRDTPDCSGSESPTPERDSEDLRNNVPGVGQYPGHGVMYQTPQGMVYATPTSAVPNGVIFSIAQGNNSNSNASASQTSQQQFITIPVPMALSAAAAAAAANGHHPQEAADLTKTRK